MIGTIATNDSVAADAEWTGSEPAAGPCPAPSGFESHLRNQRPHGTKMPKKSEARKRAFEMYLAKPDITIGQIAKDLGVSKQYLYAIAKRQHWVERREEALKTFRSGGADMDDAMQQAVVTLRLGLAKRLQELEALCTDTDTRVRLGAIRTWLQIAKDFTPEDRGPQTIEVYNDLRDQSDNRQVIVQKAPDALEAPSASP